MKLADWSEFEPTTDRERMAYALMVAGVVDDSVLAVDARGFVGLDYGTAERVLEELEHLGYRLAAGRATQITRAGNDGSLAPSGEMAATRQHDLHDVETCQFCGTREDLITRLHDMTEARDVLAARLAEKERHE